MGVFILRGTSMITKEQLLTLDTLPHIKDISLKLYKDLCVDILFKRRFHYYFTDGTDMIVEFREWGVYHMLSIQHIDYTIPKDDFFHRIDSGLELSDFTINNSIKQRYRKEKERITMFACVYSSLRYGRVFYLPERYVPNTKNVRVDYLVQRIVNGKGLNLGIRYEDGRFIPLTILISKSSNPDKYVDIKNQKVVSRLLITDIESGDEIENIIYTDDFIVHMSD